MNGKKYSNNGKIRIKACFKVFLREIPELIFSIMYLNADNTQAMEATPFDKGSIGFSDLSFKEKIFVVLLNIMVIMIVVGILFFISL